jgi:formylglycine-generating enzyme required for sulfatase activity
MEVVVTLLISVLGLLVAARHATSGMLIGALVGLVCGLIIGGGSVPAVLNLQAGQRHGERFFGAAKVLITTAGGICLSFVLFPADSGPAQGNQDQTPDIVAAKPITSSAPVFAPQRTEPVRQPAITAPQSTEPITPPKTEAAPAPASVPTTRPVSAPKTNPAKPPYLDVATEKPKRLEIDLSDNVKLEMVRIEAGEFWMGGPDEAVTTTEIPNPFYLGKFEVTQAQWQAVMRKKPSHFDDSRGGGPDHPVERVSWDDVQEFIENLNDRERGRGLLYRLPTEAEWEYACRGGATSREDCSYRFYLGESSNSLDSTQANFNGKYPAGKGAKAMYVGHPNKVGSYQPNRLGLYDMHGNVWEWTADAKRSGRVIRGGGWRDPGARCQATYREEYASDTRSDDLGFRLAAVAGRSWRQRTNQRWSLGFSGKGQFEWIRALGGVGAFIAVPVRVPASDQDYEVIRDLSVDRLNPKRTKEDHNGLKRVSLFVDEPKAVDEVRDAFGLETRPSHFVIFIPKEVEKTLLKLEAELLGGHSEAEISATYFVIRNDGKRYIPEVSLIVLRNGVLTPGTRR